MLAVSNGVLVLKHFDAVPFGLEALVLSHSIGHQASQPALAPAPPAASVVPILGVVTVALGDFLVGGLVEFDQKELLVLLRQRKAKNLHHICSHKYKLVFDYESQGAAADGGTSDQASKVLD